MIDFHCHLDLYPDPHDVAVRCADHGLYVLAVTTTPSAWRGTAALADGVGRIQTALGLHPQLANVRASELPLFDELLKQARYVGEIGLDGAPEFKAHWSTQLSVFKHVLGACARAGGRIMSIHSSRAAAAVLDLLEAYNGVGVPVMHWFSGCKRDLERAIRQGCWFSVGPAMLRSRTGRELTALMPRDRILTESDGPFAQINGASLMPWQVRDALHVLGDLWSTSTADVEETIQDNLKALLKLVPDTRDPSTRTAR